MIVRGTGILMTNGLYWFDPRPDLCNGLLVEQYDAALARRRSGCDSLAVHYPEFDSRSRDHGFKFQQPSFLPSRA